MTVIVSGEALYQWREWAITQSKAHNIDPYEVDWFLQGATSLASLSLTLGSYQNQAEISISAPLSNLTEKWKQRIEQRVPVQYLTGETPWRHFLLSVTSDVLIPRPETELIINIAQTLVEQDPIAEQHRTGNWADLGTGSGAIALGLAHTFPRANIHAVDISEEALAVAKHNATKNDLSDRITFYQGNWLTPLTPLKGNLTAILTNPPYIPSQTILTLQPEVTHHEPHLALDGGPDGLGCIRTLITQSATYLTPSGLFLTELMSGQATTVAALLAEQQAYSHITIHPDLSGIKRFVSARKAL
ncbi:MAG: peptide chain release factor N(5)-glutamine methyltransferase [Cyanobacteria bacterium J06621_11]